MGDQTLDYNDFTKSTKNDIQVITATGEFVYQTLARVKELFYRIYDASEPLILDVSQVTQIDSTGFGFVLNIIKQLKQPTDLVILVEDEFIYELFSITKIDKLVTIVTTLEAAIHSIDKNK